VPIPSTFVNADAYDKKLLHFHIIDLCIRIYVSYLYIIVLFSDILFRYNTLFTYTSKNILLVIGLIFSVFLGPDEHLQVYECPFAERQLLLTASKSSN